MGKWAENAEVYVNDVKLENSIGFKPPEEKVMPEKNTMCLAQAFITLHKVHDVFDELGLCEEAEALEVLFHWIDEMSLLLKCVNGELEGEDQ